MAYKIAGSAKTEMDLESPQTVTGAKTFSLTDTLIAPSVAPTSLKGSLGLDAFNNLNYFDGTRNGTLWRAMTQEAAIRPSGATGSINTFGFYSANITASVSASNTVTSTNGVGAASSTSGVSGNVASVVNTANLMRIDQKPFFVWKFLLNQTAAERFTIGLVDSTTASIFTGVTGDDPSAGYFALQFSTNRGDTNWQFIRRASSGGSQTIVNTTITPSTTVVYTLVMDIDGTNLTMALVDDTPSLLWTTTVSSNLPPATTAIGFHYALETLANVIKTFTIYGVNYVKLRSS